MEIRETKLNEKIFFLPFKVFYFKRRQSFDFLLKALLLLSILLMSKLKLHAQSVTGSTWDAATATASSGYTNWGSGVISLTDTTTGSGSCQGSAVIETSGYNPATDFSQCYRVFFGCPGNDQIGTSGNPYTDQNGDGMAFSFWKNNATYNANNTNTCGGGLGYHSALTGGDNDGKMITIEFDTYSSIGTNGVDGCYGGGAPGSGDNDEISIHKDMDSGDSGLLTGCPNTGGTVNAGNLEDGLVHDVCISYSASTHILTVKLDGTTMVSYDLGSTYNLNTYFGGKTLNYSWSAGKYGANNLQTIAPAGTNITGVVGHPLCPGITPVRLVDFKGEVRNDIVSLNWTTATEVNNDKFVIEKSYDLKEWKTVGDVAGNGNSTFIINYNFDDYEVPKGVVYYRLKQIDFNGTYEYSKIIELQSSDKQTVSIVPNPFEDNMKIQSAYRGQMDIKIYDLLGSLVYSATIENNNEVSIKPNLVQGAYVITIQTEEFIEQQKIIKK